MKKKFLILFILFSLTIHALVILLSLRINLPAVTHNDPVMKVELKTPQEVEKPRARHSKTPTRTFADDGTEADPAREASVGLENPGGVYEPYLLNIRRRIERLWSYPPQALAENREGSAVIRFTIAANGTLAGSSVLTSSGNFLLDEGALACIRGASPFDPLPASFNLSLLNVTATFSYRINL
ncbi:MAG: energy transducer TonB [Syntrophales bacterium]|jgi:protein TonB|nr:energy transducer TonB [Syntrophales bacterium]